MQRDINCKAFFDILNQKYYSQSSPNCILDQVSQLKEALQRKSGVQIMTSKPDQSSLVFQCSNVKLYQCLFSQHFKKVQEQAEEVRYQLVKTLDSHSQQCMKTHKKQQRSVNKSWITNNSNSKRDNLQQALVCNPQVKIVKSQKNSQFTDVKQPIQLGIKAEELKRLYTECKNKLTQEQIGLLKKQLELRSKGLLSKSTQSSFKLKIIQEQIFTPNQITQIYFHCKYDPQNCPYKAKLKLADKSKQTKTEKLFELQIINQNHNSQCLLDHEDICFNYMSMKIDRQFETLVRIIRQNSNATKPKEILKQFSKQIGEQDQSFIYKGIKSKLKKRSIKKYFDNSLAKARNIINAK